MRIMTTFKVLLLMAAVAALTLNSPPIFAQSANPHRFIGSAMVNGLNAPAGTTITAMIDGEAKASTIVGTNGQYGPLLVNGGGSTIITFEISSLLADQIALWEQGGASALNLTAAPTTFDCSVVNSIPDQECEALVSLYNSTDGPNWTNKTDWLATTTPCSWYGITCSGDRVTIIALGENQLTGAIPPELGNLANLQSLYLSASLQNLDLYVNRLTGAIPPELGNLANLQTLDLSGNQLTGAIPIELANLASLQTLYLHVNQLTGAIPIELANLANLQTLDLSGNQLTGAIPIELANLANLQDLELGSNQLTGAIPIELANLANLQVLDLSRNQLTGAIPPELNLSQGETRRNV